MEISQITADNINVSSDEPQTFFYVFSMLANGIMKLLLHYVGKVRKNIKNRKVETIINTGSWFANFRFCLDALVFHLLYKRYTIAKQSLGNR